MSENYFVGVDIGGTFTDVFISDGKDYWKENPPLHLENFMRVY